MKIKLAIAAAGVVIATLPGSAQAHPGVNQCADLAEPGTRLARHCEDLGWTIDRLFAENPYNVIRRVEVPPCEFEDSPAPCFWDAAKRGNGEGQSFLRYKRWGLNLIEYTRGFRLGRRHQH